MFEEESTGNAILVMAGLTGGWGLEDSPSVWILPASSCGCG